jgi:hypothetical protein
VNERQAFTIGLFAMSIGMIAMAYAQPALWEVKLLEVILQALVITGLLNMAGAFHFAANQASAKATENTGAAFRAIEAAAHSRPPGTPTGNPGDPLHVTEEDDAGPPTKSGPRGSAATN